MAGAEQIELRVEIAETDVGAPGRRQLDGGLRARRQRARGRDLQQPGVVRPGRLSAAGRHALHREPRVEREQQRVEAPVGRRLHRDREVEGDAPARLDAHRPGDRLHVGARVVAARLVGGEPGGAVVHVAGRLPGQRGDEQAGRGRQPGPEGDSPRSRSAVPARMKRSREGEAPRGQDQRGDALPDADAAGEARDEVGRHLEVEHAQRRLEVDRHPELDPELEPGEGKRRHRDHQPVADEDGEQHDDRAPEREHRQRGEQKPDHGVRLDRLASVPVEPHRQRAHRLQRDRHAEHGPPGHRHQTEHAADQELGVGHGARVEHLGDALALVPGPDVEGQEDQAQQENHHEVQAHARHQIARARRRRRWPRTATRGRG